MDWYFDVISPYAYLQSRRLGDLNDAEAVTCIPVLFAGLLNHWGHLGPAELPPKRQWTFEHVTWLAHRDKVPITMPAHHPFNPLPLLRLCAAAGNTIDAVQKVFDFVWVDGKVPTDQPAFEALCRDLNVQTAQLSDQAVKDAIRANTENAVACGVFGVPTVRTRDQNFWGYDATDMTLAFLAANGDEQVFPATEISRSTQMPEGLTRARPGPKPPTPKSSEPRLPYQPIDLAEPADVVKAVRERRGGTLLELDRMLLYSPALAAGWNELMGAVRTKFIVDAKLRELAMCTVAVINEAAYEFVHHKPLFIKAGGTEAQASALAQPENALKNTELFDERERAALGLSIDMTRTVQINQNHFDTCRKFLSDQELVELIATIAAYNMVSRVLVALNVQPDADH